MKRWTGQDVRVFREDVLDESRFDFSQRVRCSLRSIERWEGGGAIGRKSSQALSKALREAPEWARAEFETRQLAPALSTAPNVGVPEQHEHEVSQNGKGDGPTKRVVVEAAGEARESTRGAEASALGSSTGTSRSDPAANGGVGEGSISALIRLAATDSAAFVRELAADSNRPALLEQLHADVHRLAVAGRDTRPAKVLAEVFPIRHAAFRVIRQNRQPTDDKDLLLLTGYLSGILAYAALDLGFDDEAATHARASWVAADLAGHNGLRAWVRGTQSLITRFKGQYDAAYDLIEDGFRYAGDGTSEVRLLCGQAQCLAHFGDSTATHAALNRAKDKRDGAKGRDAVGCLFGFSLAKQSYYSGSSLIWLPGAKDARVAEEESARAIRLWESGPEEERSNVDEGLAHVYLATARLHLGELDGVLEALQPVLAIPANERVSWHGKRLGRIADLLESGPHRNAEIATRIHAEIDEFKRSMRQPA